MPWYVISAVSHRLMILVLAFHRTYTIPMPQKYLQYPLWISKTVYQAHDSAKYPNQNAAYMSATTFSQLDTSGSSSLISYQSHWQKCSASIANGPPEWFRRRHSTASEISASPLIYSFTEKGVTSTGMELPVGGTWR